MSDNRFRTINPPWRWGTLVEILNGPGGGQGDSERAHTELARLQHEQAQEIIELDDGSERRWRWENRLRACEGAPPLTREEWDERNP